MFQVVLNGIIVGGIYALISIGFALVYSSVRFYHLAYCAIAIFGTYITYTFQQSLGLGFLPSLFLSSFLFGFFGVGFWNFFYKPLIDKKATDISMIVASFGLLIVFQNISALIFGNAAKSLYLSQTVKVGYNFFNLYITQNQIMILAFTVIAILILEFILKKTRLGTAIRATGQNLYLATTVGIKSKSIINYSFFIATFISVFGSSLIALEIGIRPIYSLTLMLKVTIACIIGGMGDLRGAFVGGLMLGIIENFGIYFFGASYQDITAFSLLVIFLIFKPNGIFGKA